MTAKNKPQKRLTQGYKKADTVEINPTINDVLIPEEVKTDEEYIPSLNAEKYPVPEAPTIQYKILAFKNDYIKLQDEVMKHLNEGWKLTGGVSTSMTVSPYESVTVFTQAVFKG